MSQIETLAEFDLTPQDDAAIGDLLRACFDTDFGGRSYFVQRHHLRFIARDQGQIIAHLALTIRDIRVNDALVAIAGVGDVATAPIHRGRGIAAQLLDRAIAAARTSLAEFMLLYGDAGLYAAAGFRPANNPGRYVNMEGATTQSIQTAPQNDLMVLAIGTTVWDEDATLDLMGHLF
jgi:predicted N-acetyltransferase YhbS